ncbi:MAG: hypothetical protein VB858_12770 [Planctomycetaceae bacterium]
MKFALLGYDTQLHPLLDALARTTEHSVVFAVGFPNAAAGTLLAHFPAIRICESWEELLSSSFDRLIVAGQDPLLLEAARQLATDGQPTVILPHIGQGSAFVYSLSLIHDDNGVPLIPLLPLATNPLVDQMLSQISAGAIGAVTLLRLERQLLPDEIHLSIPEIDAALLHDAGLLRRIGGSYDRVTAVHAGTSPTAVSQATVTLAGNTTTEAIWICRAGRPCWQLTVSGSSGEARLTLNPEQESAWSQTEETSPCGQLEIQSTGVPTIHTDIEFRALAEAHITQAARTVPAPDDWSDMTRTVETVEATHISLRRRRTIDLYFEATSERSIFKSQMTAVGCGLLMLTLFGLVAFLLLGAFLDSRTVLQRNAEAGGRVVHETEFATGTALMNPVGQQHIEELARKLERKSESVLVMPGTGDNQNKLDSKRVAAVIQALVDRGRPEALQLVSLAEIPNPITQGLLKLLRIAWIAPLVLFLLMQTLLFITRPATAEN